MSSISFYTFLITLVFYSHEQPPDTPVSIIAQTTENSSNDLNVSLNSKQTTGNSTITIGTIEKYHNATEPSYLYIVQLELKSSRVDEPFAEIEKRLDKLVEMAFVLAAYKHRKQTPPAEITTANSGYSTKIIKKRTSGELTHIHFVTYAGSEPVIGEVVADDMTLLSASQISATLRYQLGKIISDRDIEKVSSTKWWLILGAVGSGVILCIIGWFGLFVYYNTCGYMYGTDEGDYMTRIQRAKMKKQLIINPLPSQCEPAAEQPNDALPSDGSNPSASTKKPRLNKKMQRSCRTLSEIHLERRIKNEHENIRKAIQEAFDKAVEENKEAALAPLPSSFGPVAVDTENTDVETAQHAFVAKSEKRRRHPKIGPITAVTTTTTTNEQEEKTPEISGLGSATTLSTQEMDEFDVPNLPDTTLKISKKKKDEKEAEVRSEPESDYGSSLDDEKSKDDEEVEKEIHDEVRVRPMTAKKQRTSLFGGNGISPLPTQPRAWTVYQAGDKVAAFWNNEKIHSHPTPSSPSEAGILEIGTSKTFNYD